MSAGVFPELIRIIFEFGICLSMEMPLRRGRVARLFSMIMPVFRPPTQQKSVADREGSRPLFNP